ncbi:hypothetical protein CVT26_003489 [Gymnopilus dilepis]|uniref:Uncharacterized protein n=1 Tax=Gymnopilus dilepis TaxID=231916 RepID=A0A409W2W3_9AGAR|nr:hypothetical protein CVT26_003489 [Gymnopilus dilepis]
MPGVIPKSITFLTALSVGVCIPMIALSVVNFGMLSIWLNSTVATVILLHHFAFLITAFVTSKESKPPRLLAEEDESERSIFEEDEAEPSTFTHIANVAVVTFLVILDATAFIIMVDITRLGAIKSTLPAERIGSHKWNLKIEIGQTCVLGVELLVLCAILAICVSGRRRFIAEQKEKMDEMDYGLA